MKSTLKGIWSPIPTPLRKNGAIDVARTRILVDHLIDNGVDGLLPLGTSGEFALLSKDERNGLLEAVVDQVNGRVTVVGGVSDTSTDNVIAYAKSAQDVGVDAVMATPPYYYTVTQEGIYEHYKRVHEKIELPLMVYNIPGWTHNFVSVQVVERLADEKLVVGMKYTENDLLNLLMFLSTSGKKIAIFTGSDALAYTALEFGGAGAIMGTANVAPRKASSIFDLYRTGEHTRARKAQMELLPIIEAISIGQFPAGLKEAMKLVGMPVGDAKPPLLPLSPEQKAGVRNLLKRGGML